MTLRTKTIIWSCLQTTILTLPLLFYVTDDPSKSRTISTTGQISSALDERSKLQQHLIELLDQLRALQLTDDEMGILSAHLTEDSSKISTVLTFLNFQKLHEYKLAYNRRFIRLINWITPGMFLTLFMLVSAMALLHRYHRHYDLFY
ncbi:uncharacterized protein VTP21DRAFT_9546 [Calcarisporiella thermophila]|uniref:uncharacterized protein n=1 Tax=Calcarisporiella thermophila TaxID=911321 RepID=UPI0037434523